MGTAIEWTDETWNPVTGCTKVSPGCDHCYAERITERFHGPGSFEKVVLHPERLDMPLRWRKPRMVDVNSMSDLFHDDVPDEFIARAFEVMGAARQHTFQVLTKRPGRMASLLARWSTGEETYRRPDGIIDVNALPIDAAKDAAEWGCGPWPLPNVWLGTSVESQNWADVRIPKLLETPAAVGFLSCEPLLGPIDLTRWVGACPSCGTMRKPERNDEHREDELNWTLRNPLRCVECGEVCGFEDWREDPLVGIDWLIVGGESGPGARPMHPDWARSLRDQCVAAGVPFFFKQWGEWAEASKGEATHLLARYGVPKAGGGRNEPACIPIADGTMDYPYGLRSGTNVDLVDRGHDGWVRMRRIGRTRAGRQLDERTWDEYPKGEG